VLVVEDDRKIADVVRIYAEREGYWVLLAGDGRQALAVVDAEQPDIVVLDLLLPGMDGREVCRVLRQQSRIPVIMLTALSHEADMLEGLNLGADDYLTKPFSPRELMARIRAVLRRSSDQLDPPPPPLRVGSLSIDLVRHRASIGDRELALTNAELSLLKVLAREPERVFSRSQLIDAAYDESFDAFERVVDSHVKNLRRKLAAYRGANAPVISAVYGVGYRLQAG
jgi:two-component system alkaline phosphatase synthesis response regulator PhoP